MVVVRGRLLLNSRKSNQIQFYEQDMKKKYISKAFQMTYLVLSSGMRNQSLHNKVPTLMRRQTEQRISEYLEE